MTDWSKDLAGKMSRLMRARLWLGAASVGTFVFVTSLAAMVRSCERAHWCPVMTVVERDALIWSSTYAAR